MISYRTIIERIAKVSKDSKVQTAKPRIGGMYSFGYNPKTKDKMPYYDMFPLVIPVEPAEGGFFGLNFHYIDAKSRGILLDIIAPLTDSKSSRKTIQVSYKKLKALSSSVWAPCFKRYLWSHIKTKIVNIPMQDWREVAKIPVISFTGSTAASVHKDSRRLF